MPKTLLVVGFVGFLASDGAVTAGEGVQRPAPTGATVQASITSIATIPPMLP